MACTFKGCKKGAVTDGKLCYQHLNESQKRTNNIPKLLAAKGWNKNEFSLRLGLSTKTVYQDLMADDLNTTWRVMRRVADVLGVSLDELETVA